jgi:hypothetical protein
MQISILGLTLTIPDQLMNLLNSVLTPILGPFLRLLDTLVNYIMHLFGS